VPSASRSSNGRSHTSLTICTWEPVIPQLGHEAAEGRAAFHELLDILNVPDLAYFCDG
jgi:hypothetical protein